MKQAAILNIIHMSCVARKSVLHSHADHSLHHLLEASMDPWISNKEKLIFTIIWKDPQGDLYLHLSEIPDNRFSYVCHAGKIVWCIVQIPSSGLPHLPYSINPVFYWKIRANKMNIYTQLLN